MYTLKKLEIEEGKSSFIPTGYATRGYLLTLFKATDPATDKKVNSLDDIEEGWQIFLSTMTEWHRTSAIKEIVSRENNKVVFKTQTSLYELRSDNNDPE